MVRAAASTSARVITPSGPVPTSCVKSTPAARARRRAAGETRSRAPATGAAGGGATVAGATRGGAAGGGSGRWCGRSGQRLTRRSAGGPNASQHRPHRHLGARRDQQRVHHPVFERLHVDGALDGFHHRDDLSPVDGVARLDLPLHQAGGFHVRPQRRHTEITHDPASPSRPGRCAPVGEGRRLPGAWDREWALRRRRSASPAHRVRKSTAP